jgi:hypothetical protein
MKNIARLAMAMLFVASVAPAASRTHHTADRTSNAAARTSHNADRPTFLGAFKDWSAYTRGISDMKVCYALSEPKSKEPARAKRDPAYFLINDWPQRRSKAEAEIVPGYQYRDGSTVTVQVGAVKFAFFTKNEAGAGGAWVLNPSDEDRLLGAMRNGTTAVVTGTSRRGTLTHDTYGLSGISDALDRIHQSCGM